MRQRLYCFLVVFLLMFCGRIFAQQGSGIIVVGIDPDFFKIRMVETSQKSNQLLLVSQKIYYSQNNISPVQRQLSSFSAIQIISPSLYASQLGFICKKEWQLEKITSIPFRFRLGSLAYVNYLEQKPNAKNLHR